MRKILTLALLVAACSSPAGSDAGSIDGAVGLDGGQDAGPPAMGVDAGPEPVDAGGPCAVPVDGFGTTQGRSFAPLTLGRCDGTTFDFYEGDSYCDAAFTVLTVAGGASATSRATAAELEAGLEAGLVERYAADQVRVVVALLEDDVGGTPSADFCAAWAGDYGLTCEVGVDADRSTQAYFPAGSMPATLIVDDRGVIRHREYGVGGLDTVRAELDHLLGML